MKKDFSEKEIISDLKINAKALAIPSGAANAFIEKIMNGAKKSLKNKKIIMKKDLDRAILKELCIYNGDLAYVYENRDKII